MRTERPDAVDARNHRARECGQRMEMEMRVDHECSEDFNISVRILPNDGVRGKAVTGDSAVEIGRLSRRRNDRPDVASRHPGPAGSRATSQP
jgi:hypothetical protein